MGVRCSNDSDGRRLGEKNGGKGIRDLQWCFNGSNGGRLGEKNGCKVGLVIRVCGSCSYRLEPNLTH
ncbi:hypothetical protein TIFTF001_031081 [Ficus carica]|uniref:Uncharacterized protein n=1 Tax=Ficus carica TaxID=3494 RepID=A0AA88E002_FICCA|nr:hypothetical protein TIFTF001_031081 [Ficus carica]